MPSMRPLLITGAAALATLATPMQAETKREIFRIAHEIRQVEGWNVLVDPDLLAGGLRKSIEELQAQSPASEDGQ